MSSSQTSDRNTNMASSFELSSCCSFVDAFTHVEEGPPKKLILPKHDLAIAPKQRNEWTHTPPV